MAKIAMLRGLGNSSNISAVVEASFLEVFGSAPTRSEIVAWSSIPDIEDAIRTKITGRGSLLETLMLMAKKKGDRLPEGVVSQLSARTKETVLFSEVFEAVFGREPTSAEVLFWRRKAKEARISDAYSLFQLMQKSLPSQEPSVPPPSSELPPPPLDDVLPPEESDSDAGTSGLFSNPWLLGGLAVGVLAVVGFVFLGGKGGLLGFRGYNQPEDDSNWS